MMDISTKMPRELQEIRATLAARPELVDFFKAFMDLNADTQARILTALQHTDLLTAIRNSLEVTEQ